MITINIDAIGVITALSDLDQALEDMTPVFAELGELLADKTRDRFLESSDTEGNPWKPKMQSTIDAYASRGDRADHRPLFGPSLQLSQSIDSNFGSDFLELSTPMVYAAVQQFGAAKGAFGVAKNGSPIPWGDIPARPFMGFSDEDEKIVISVIEEWIEDSFES